MAAIHRAKVAAARLSRGTRLRRTRSALRRTIEHGYTGNFELGILVTRTSQKKREIQAVEHLRDVFTGFPERARIEGSDEPLDVVVAMSNGHRIGVEVTHFVVDGGAKGSRRDSYQELTRKIAKASENAYAIGGGAPLYITLRFNEDLTCASAQIPVLAERIAGCARRLADFAVAEHSLQSDDDLPAGVDELIVHPFPLPRPQFAVTYCAPW